VVLKNIRVNPSKDFPLSIEENHILINNEKSIVISKGTASIYYCLSVEKAPFAIVVLLELENGLVLQIINPNLKNIIL
jgi:hypothetical protein